MSSSGDVIFGYYHQINDNIYDFRIRNHEIIDSFKYLNIFNLALILAKNLNIKFFFGYDDSNNQSLFELDLIKTYNRFKKFDNPIIYPYILIRINNQIPYLRIINYEGINNFYLNLDYTKPIYDIFKIHYELQPVSNSNESKSKVSENKLYLINSLMDGIIYYYKSNRTKLEKYKLDIKLDQSISFPYFGLLYIDREKQILIKITHDEFKSLLFNCLPTPLISNAEIANSTKIINHYDNTYIDIKGQFAFAVDPSDTSKDRDDAIRFEEFNDQGRKFIKMYVYVADVSPYINKYNLYLYNYFLYKQ